MRVTRNFCVSFSNFVKKNKIALNDVVSSSKIGKYFKLQERESSFTTELRAGTTTFVAMAYAISVCATLLADTGGTCPVSDWPSLKYEACKAVVKNDLIVAISLAAMIGCFAMGLLANLPLGLCPGSGQTMFMAYNLVGLNGSGPMTYQNALGLWMVEAVAFLVISGSGLRAKLGRFIPPAVRLGTAAGIGMFMAFIGLQIHQGVGLIGPDSSSLVTITACSHTDQITGSCKSGILSSPTFWLGAVGFLIMSYGLAHEIHGSMMFGILFVTLISWFRGTSVTYFPKTDIGESRYNYFKKMVNFHKIHKIAGKVSFTAFSKGSTWVSLFTLLYIDLLATTGLLFTLVETTGLTNTQGSFENEYIAYMVDAAVTVFTTFLGVAPVSVYGESLAGIKEGGRTGLTSVFVGMYFILALFFAPLLTSVPPWAIGPSLVMVGVLMMKVVKDINWCDIRQAVPAFVTIILMPFSSSIPNGIIGGVGIHVALRMFDWVVPLVKKVVKPKQENPMQRLSDTADEHNDIDNI